MNWSIVGQWALNCEVVYVWIVHLLFLFLLCTSLSRFAAKDQAIYDIDLRIFIASFASGFDPCSCSSMSTSPCFSFPCKPLSLIISFIFNALPYSSSSVTTVYFPIVSRPSSLHPSPPRLVRQNTNHSTNNEQATHRPTNHIPFFAELFHTGPEFSM